MEPNNNMGGNNPLGGESVISEQVVTEQVTETPMSPAVAPEKKKNNGMLLGLILCIVLAIGGIGFGVWMMMDSNTQKDSLNKQISDLRKQNNDLLEQVGDNNTTINIDTDDGDVDTADYIYVGEWGVKIKIPENLKKVSYVINAWGNSDDKSLCVSGVTGDDGRLPDFANLYENFPGLGCIALESKDSTDQPLNATRVFSDDLYNYVYSGPQAVYSTSDEEVDWEVESVQLVKEMLSNQENYSAI